MIPVNIRLAHRQVSFHSNTDNQEALKAKKNVDERVNEEWEKNAVDLRDEKFGFCNQHHDQKEKITNCKCNQTLLKS